jgi:tRNA pseudouridine13 synthase
MYKLKQIPEDFIVKEISNVKLENSGKFMYFILRKKNRNTLDVIKELSRQLGISEKNIGFAGSKDKHAFTEQMISIKGNKLSKLKIDNVSLELVGYGNKRISLGDLKGNNFEIVVRNLNKCEFNQITFIENYYDEQRFSNNNVAIGKHLINKEFKQAVVLIDDVKVKKFIEEHPKDFVGALKKLPMRLLKMYVHSFQSFLWNFMLADKLRKGDVLKEVKYSMGEFVFVNKKWDIDIPLLGFSSEFNSNNLDLDDLKLDYLKLDDLKLEYLEPADFIIRQIPELSMEGGMRESFVEIKSFKIGKKEKDELNQGKNKVKVSFFLPKGSYATMVIRKLFIK